MDHILSTYGNILVPGAIAIIALTVVMRIVSAIFKMVALAVLAVVLFGGYTAYTNVSSVENAAKAVVFPHSGLYSEQYIKDKVYQMAKNALVQSNLDPSKLHVGVQCAGANTQVYVWYDDNKFLLGALSGQHITVPLGSSVRC